jgi:hypothetical protein
MRIWFQANAGCLCFPRFLGDFRTRVDLASLVRVPVSFLDKRDIRPSPDVFTGSLSKPVAALVKSVISKDPCAGNATGSSFWSSTSAGGRMITAAIVHGVGVAPPPVMSMSRGAHRARGGSGRGGLDFGRTDTTSCTERSTGDQANEQRFPLRGHSLSARALSRCFLDEGSTIHTSPISTGPSATRVIPTTGRETANHWGGADYRREGRPTLSVFACAVNRGGRSGSLRAGG